MSKKKSITAIKNCNVLEIIKISLPSLYKQIISLFISAEALHIGSLIAAQGYIFPISDHVLNLKDDGTFYRFQVGYRTDMEHTECPVY